MKDSHKRVNQREGHTLHQFTQLRAQQEGKTTVMKNHRHITTMLLSQVQSWISLLALCHLVVSLSTPENQSTQWLIMNKLQIIIIGIHQMSLTRLWSRTLNVQSDTVLGVAGQANSFPYSALHCRSVIWHWSACLVLGLSNFSLFA